MPGEGGSVTRFFMNVKRDRGAKALGLFLILCACHEEAPSGQVLARVGREDVTKRDVASEENADSGGSQADMLDRVIERKLLLQRAVSVGLDRSPEYLAQIRRLKEVLLANLERQSLGVLVPSPTSRDVLKYQQTRRWMFADRMLTLIEPDSPNVSTASNNASGNGSLPGAQRWVDSFTLSRELAATFALAQTGQDVSIGGSRAKVVRRLSMPLTGAKADKVAFDALRDLAKQKAIEEVIGQERIATRIVFQRGIGPAGD